MNCLDAREVDDPASMDPQESRGVETAIKIREALAQKKPARTTVQLNIVVGRFDPVDGIHGHKIKALALFHDDAVRPLPHARIQQCLQLHREVRLAMRCDVLAGPFYTAPQTEVVEGLQQSGRRTS